MYRQFDLDSGDSIASIETKIQRALMTQDRPATIMVDLVGGNQALGYRAVKETFEMLIRLTRKDEVITATWSLSVPSFQAYLEDLTLETPPISLSRRGVSDEVQGFGVTESDLLEMNLLNNSVSDLAIESTPWGLFDPITGIYTIGSAQGPNLQIALCPVVESVEHLADINLLGQGLTEYFGTDDRDAVRARLGRFPIAQREMAPTSAEISSALDGLTGTGFFGWNPNSAFASEWHEAAHDRVVATFFGELVDRGGWEQSNNVAGIAMLDRHPCHAVILLFTYPRRQPASEALRDLLRQARQPVLENERLPRLIGELFIAASVEGPAFLGPSYFAWFNPIPVSIDSSTLNRKQVNAIIEHQLNHICNRQSQDALPPDWPVTNPVDAARIWIGFVRQLWSMTTMEKIANAQIPDLAVDDDSLGWTTRSRLATLAMFARETLGVDSVQISGVTISTNDHVEKTPLEELTAWVQAMEWLRGNVPREALHAFGAVWPQPYISLIDPEVQAEASDELGHGIAATLLATVDSEKAYVLPERGLTFKVEIPEGLFSDEINQMIVWANPSGMWVSLVTQQGAGPSFHWTPSRGNRFSQWVQNTSNSMAMLHEKAIPRIDATLAALWHDLHVAGPEATLHKKDAPSPRPSSKETHAREGKKSTRRLPGDRKRSYFFEAGEYTWGDPEEQKRIRRQAHGVRGHLRELSAEHRASKEQIELAKQYGLIVPKGYTFVRPHIRGGDHDGLGLGLDGDQVMQPTPIRCLGLATVMTLLGK